MHGRKGKIWLLGEQYVLDVGSRQLPSVLRHPAVPHAASSAAAQEVGRWIKELKTVAFFAFLL